MNCWLFFIVCDPWTGARVFFLSFLDDGNEMLAHVIRHAALMLNVYADDARWLRIFLDMTQPSGCEPHGYEGNSSQKVQFLTVSIVCNYVVQLNRWCALDQDDLAQA